VCDYNNQRLPSGADPVCTSANTARSEGGPPRNNVDIDRAYDYSGATYNFYSQNFGRDSIDGQGMELKSSVRVCLANDDCPYPNAFWDGTKMVYGQGFAAADDVVGHELTHGVTERTSGLFYAYQSGAINESISDIMGEFVDQTYSPAGTKDGPQYNWLLGEDLPIAAIRDMANPGRYGQPDSMVSPQYFGEARYPDDTTFPVDNGGVHYNSGVGNKAAYLMTAGGTFRNVTVTALGIPKVAQVWYLADQLLSSGADYADLAVTLDNACQQLRPPVPPIRRHARPARASGLCSPTTSRAAAASGTRRPRRATGPARPRLAGRWSRPTPTAARAPRSARPTCTRAPSRGARTTT
jgi:Zn-dependent metalloprotease